MDLDPADLPRAGDRRRRCALRAGPFGATIDRRRVELIGAVLVTAGLLALVFGVSNTSSAGWADRETLLALAGSGLLLTAFAAVERARREPWSRMFFASAQIGSGGMLAACAIVFAANADAGLGAHHGGMWVVVVAIGLAALPALAMAARRAGDRSRRIERRALTRPPATEDARR